MLSRAALLSAGEFLIKKIASVAPIILLIAESRNENIFLMSEKR